MAIVTLTTDFGMRDGNVGVMKGVIWGICPQANIADLSHEIGAQNIHQAAFVLERSAFYFPAGTVHIAVVDPGVGTARYPIAVQVNDHYLVGPDNGIFTPLIMQAEMQGRPVKAVRLTNQVYWRDDISSIFHGRDIFAPVGAHLASGVALEALGEPIETLIRIPWPLPSLKEDEITGEVMHIDRFGNIHTNIRREHLEELTIEEVRLGDLNIKNFSEVFGQFPAGNIVAMFSSTGALLVAQVNGDAARAAGARLGQPVRVFVKRS